MVCRISLCAMGGSSILWRGRCIEWSTFGKDAIGSRSPAGRRIVEGGLSQNAIDDKVTRRIHRMIEAALTEVPRDGTGRLGMDAEIEMAKHRVLFVFDKRQGAPQ